MALKPIESEEFIIEILGLIETKAKGADALITSLEYIEKELEKRGFKFTSEDFCLAINSLVVTKRAKFGILVVSEYNPDTHSINIVFDLNKDKKEQS